MVAKIWVVSFGAQEDGIKEYCFKKCGKILIGAFDIDGMGMFIPCKQTECAYEEDIMDLGEWVVPDEGMVDLVARKLEAVRG
jgi:hypothetical protein